MFEKPTYIINSLAKIPRSTEGGRCLSPSKTFVVGRDVYSNNEGTNVSTNIYSSSNLPLFLKCPLSHSSENLDTHIS